MVIKMKKTNRILIVLIIIFLLLTISSNVFAINPDTYKPSDPTTEEAKQVTQKVGIILGVVRNASVIVAVIVLMIIGIKYMLGSVEEKANYKATMIPYIIGCLMAVAGSTLITYIYDVVH